MKWESLLHPTVPEIVHVLWGCMKFTRRLNSLWTLSAFKQLFKFPQHRQGSHLCLGSPWSSGGCLILGVQRGWRRLDAYDPKL